MTASTRDRCAGSRFPRRGAGEASSVPHYCPGLSLSSDLSFDVAMHPAGHWYVIPSMGTFLEYPAGHRDTVSLDKHNGVRLIVTLSEGLSNRLENEGVVRHRRAQGVALHRR